VQTINPSPENTNVLGSSAKYAVLAGLSITNSGPTTITGSMGINPGSTNTGDAITLVDGTLHFGDANSLTAQTDLTTAYNTLAGTAGGVDKSGIPLDSLTLTAGVYKYSSSCFLNGGVLTLDGAGDPNSKWIFQIGTSFTIAGSSKVLMTNSGSALNVYWQVGTSATLASSVTMVGNFVALTSITLGTSTTIEGRALARNGSVTLLSNLIYVPTYITSGCVWTP